MLAYPDMASAADAVPAVLPFRPLALEGMDARLVEVLRSRRGPAAVPPLPEGGGWLFVETGGQSLAEAVAAAEQIVRAAAPAAAAVVTGEDARRLWRIREDGAGLGGRTPANAPAWPGWEDAAVPPERLGDYLREFFALLARHRIDGLAYGHFGDGCVHVRLDFPLADRPPAFRQFLLEAATLVAAHGGSMSGEHGDGRARGELLPAMYSAEAIGLFGAVKAIFDPANLLNPGVIVDPAPVDADLRLPLARPLTGSGGRALGFSYPHDGGSFSTAVHRCVGVGKCRADLTATGGVMCPSYLATLDETHSTRGRARVLQELANGELLTEGWQSPELVEALDLCLACKGCSSDCPAGVDMATYKAEMLLPALPPPAPAGRALPAGLAAALEPAGHPGAPAGQRRAASETAGGAGQAGRWHRPAPAAAGLRAAVVPGLVRRATRSRPAIRCCCWSTPSPTRSPRRSARPPSRCWRPPAARCGIPDPAGLLRPDLDLHRPARRRPQAAAPQLRRAGAGAGRTGCRWSAWSRPAPRCCARTRSS